MLQLFAHAPCGAFGLFHTFAFACDVSGARATSRMLFQYALEHREYEAALDYLHRYFDLCVFPPAKPSAHLQRNNRIVSSGIASYALLNLAACELLFNHLDNAELCLQVQNDPLYACDTDVYLLRPSPHVAAYHSRRVLVASGTPGVL